MKTLKGIFQVFAGLIVLFFVVGYVYTRPDGNLVALCNEATSAHRIDLQRVSNLKGQYLISLRTEDGKVDVYSRKTGQQPLAYLPGSQEGMTLTQYFEERKPSGKIKIIGGIIPKTTCELSFDKEGRVSSGRSYSWD